MIHYLVNKLQFLVVFLRLLFESGVAHTAFLHSSYTWFSMMFTGTGFLLSLHSLKLLHVFSFCLSDACEINLAFSGRCNKNLVMTISCGWGLLSIWGHLAISDAFQAYGTHLSSGFFSELPCLVRCSILLLCFGRPGKHRLSYVGDNWCSLGYPFSHTRESAMFLLWGVLMCKEWVIHAERVEGLQYDSGQGFFPFNLVGSLT